ncbi:MAG TPA: beta-galactosidase [Acidobacteriaceae bacterium]|jgi:beta-galactosidase
MLNRRELLGGLLATGAGMRLKPVLAAAQTMLPSQAASGHSYNIGVSYYPEQWPQEQVAEDFARMQSLGVNTVRMGEFAWSSIQPAPQVFHFEWLDRAIALAEKNGIRVILGTPTASVPPWLYKLHPGVLSGNEKGPYTYGGRKGFALDSPAMQQAATAIITRLAARYGNRSSVIGWQLSNEPGHPPINFDPASLLAFRAWLKNRYGTLEKLNASWSGGFWSLDYDAWDEIVFPTNPTEGGWNPGIKLDYRRFFSDSFLRWLRFEAKLLRTHIRNQFIYTNWPEVAWSVDIFKSASIVDATAWDNYGATPGTTDFHNVLHTAFNHDLCRASRADQQFFISEQPSQPSADTDTRAIRLATWTDVAYGASGTLFFEWRPPLNGTEMAYVSVLESDGSFGASAPVLRETFQEISALYPRLASTKTVADLALIYSYENSWDQGFRVREGSGVGAGYDNVADRYYTGLKSLKRNVDVVPESRDLQPYRMVVAPGLRIVSDEQAAAISAWVNAGGILVLDHKAGTRSPDGRLRPLMEPGVFAKIAGLHVPAMEQARSGGITVSFDGSTKLFEIADSSTIQMQDGEVLATYHGRALDNKPAITLHAFGRGFVVYVSFTCKDDLFFDELFTHLGQRFHIQPLLDVPKGVDVVSRTNSSSEYLFLLNNTTQSLEVPLPAGMRSLLPVGGNARKIRLDALDVAILERPTT